MRHLLALPVLCCALAACTATAASPQAAARFTLESGQSVLVAPGVMLRLESVEDSRCPPGVRCVWAGRLACHFAVRRDGDPPDTFTLSPAAPAAEPALLGGRSIVLDESSLPAPAPTGVTPRHRITFTVLPPSTSDSNP
jgi:hypothetical protein